MKCTFTKIAACLSMSEAYLQIKAHNHTATVRINFSVPALSLPPPQSSTQYPIPLTLPVKSCCAILHA